MRRFGFHSCLSHSWCKTLQVGDIVHTDTTTNFDINILNIYEIYLLSLPIRAMTVAICMRKKISAHVTLQR